MPSKALAAQGVFAAHVIMKTPDLHLGHGADPVLRLRRLGERAPGRRPFGCEHTVDVAPTPAAYLGTATPSGARV